GQGQADAAVPWPRNGPPRARHAAPEQGTRGSRRDRQGRSRAEARRPTDDDGAGTALEWRGACLTRLWSLLRFAGRIAIRRAFEAARQGMPWRFLMLSG